MMKTAISMKKKAEKFQNMPYCLQMNCNHVFHTIPIHGVNNHHQKNIEI